MTWSLATLGTVVLKTNEANLAAQEKPRFFKDAVANVFDQSVHVSGATMLRTLDEIGMLQRNLSGPHGQAAQANAVDQFSG
jgi:hypothetical protein